MEGKETYLDTYTYGTIAGWERSTEFSTCTVPIHASFSPVRLSSTDDIILNVTTVDSINANVQNNTTVFFK